MLRQSSHQTFHLLVLDQTDPDISRVLQARGEEMHPLDGTIEKLCVHLPKVVLTEFPRQAFETRSEEHTSELQSRLHLVCRLLLEKKRSWAAQDTGRHCFHQGDRVRPTPPYSL